MTGYQGNIYGLTQNGQEILKYLSTLTGLSKPQNWLKTTGAIADGQSLAIDGLIYVTQASGQIKKFLSGEEQSISQPQIDPKLTGVAKIYTQTTLKYLYILDNQNKRLLVLDKNGNLVKQYTSSQFTDLRDLIISADEKQGFILTDKQILKFDL